MEFFSCLLCDIACEGVSPAGGILISNVHWFAFHAPPGISAPYTVVLAPRQHLLVENAPPESQSALAELLKSMRRAFYRLDPSKRMYMEESPGRFGHLALLLSMDERASRGELAESLVEVPRDMVFQWAGEIAMALEEEQRVYARGRLPPPPRLPQDLEYRPKVKNFCSCGASLRRGANICRKCGLPVPAGETQDYRPRLEPCEDDDEIL